ncbi:MAG: hypothetical protein L6R40_005650 [Gallowayella cf. fulva]|nr:MAG: hypothetical protein L6R40_005650 [Xanthomendoza cf. fulva]
MTCARKWMFFNAMVLPVGHSTPSPPMEATRDAVESELFRHSCSAVLGNGQNGLQGFDDDVDLALCPSISSLPFSLTTSKLIGLRHLAKSDEASYFAPTKDAATNTLKSYFSSPHPTCELPMPCSSLIYLIDVVELSYPRKDSQDKDSISTEATEYSKSGTDDASARHEDTAFDPGVTDPGDQKDKVGNKTGVSAPVRLRPLCWLLTNSQESDNPLEVSPANHDISQPRGEQEGGSENSSASSGTTSGRERSSGGGSTKKGSKVT